MKRKRFHFEAIESNFFSVEPCHEKIDVFKYNNSDELKHFKVILSGQLCNIYLKYICIYYIPI